MKIINNDRFNFKPHLCRNCGLTGHIYKNCPHPIMSFGVICYKIEDNETKFLMIQRKDSLSFMEFIRGKYELINLDYVKNFKIYILIINSNLLLNCVKKISLKRKKIKILFLFFKNNYQKEINQKSGGEDLYVR